MTPTRLLLVACLGLAACASIPEQERALMTAEIDCSRAEAQIAELQAVRPDNVRKLRAVGSTLGAAGLVVGVATNDIRDRERIASGDYEREIDTRIALIRETCGLPATAS